MIYLRLSTYPGSYRQLPVPIGEDIHSMDTFDHFHTEPGCVRIHDPSKMGNRFALQDVLDVFFSGLAILERSITDLTAIGKIPAIACIHVNIY